MPGNNFEWGFFHCKNVGKGSNYFPGKKSKLVIFHLKCILNFISEPIFKIFATLFTTFGLQKDDIVIFFLWCF